MSGLDGDAIIDSVARRRGGSVANLIVRDIDESLVRALKQQAAKHGRSAEAEHREILAAALRRPKKRHLAEALVAIPGVGCDEDFARVEDRREAKRVPR
jgi:antitoxin FitA